MSSFGPNRKEGRKKGEEGRQSKVIKQKCTKKNEVLTRINTEHGPKAVNNLVNTSALVCSNCAGILAEQTSCKRSTDPIRLRDIHVSVSVVIHLLVNAPDGLETEDGIFILAQGLVDAAQLWKEDRQEIKQNQAAHFFNQSSITLSIVHVHNRWRNIVNSTPSS